MDFRLYYQAVKEGDEGKIADYFAPARRILVSYLISVMGANTGDAEEAVQEAMVNIYESIRSNTAINESSFFSYTKSAVRNAYLSMMRKDSFISDELPEDEMIEPEQQIELLVDVDKQRVLSYCLEKLSTDYRRFIEIWLKNPDSDTEKVAKKLNTTTGNIWTKKHRVIKQLNDCVTKHLNK